MTREEAKAILENDIVDGHVEGNARFMDAFWMAVDALSQEICEDCISRQAAIEAFNLSEKTRKYGGNHSGYDTMMLYEIQDVLEDLPSVQPINRKQEEINQDLWVENETLEEEVEKYKKAIEDIKAEIKDQLEFYSQRREVSDGISIALEIINKHIAESENKK